MPLSEKLTFILYLGILWCNFRFRDKSQLTSGSVFLSFPFVFIQFTEHLPIISIKCDDLHDDYVDEHSKHVVPFFEAYIV